MDIKFELKERYKSNKPKKPAGAFQLYIKTLQRGDAGLTV